MTEDKLTHSQTANFIWSVADLLRGDFKQSQYGRIILPFTLLRRLECVLEPTREETFEAAQKHKDKPETAAELLLRRASGHAFYNMSAFRLGTLSTTQTADDLIRYVQSFSKDAREIFENFKFEEFVQQLSANNLLFQVVQRFASIDLSQEQISNYGMGLVFEELIRKFAESSNETAGEHFTPRDIVHLTTSLVFTGQEQRLEPGSIVTIYDPTAGTGGFLSEGDEYVQKISQGVTTSLFGQEINPESYAICKAEMMIKGQIVSHIKHGDTLANDQLAENKFDIMLSNPPFGVDWKKVQKTVENEHKQQGFNGRFGPGLPRVSDGSLLFLLHLVSKMRGSHEGGSRIGIILNGSPLFTGGAGSGESEIRRYLLEQDYVEAIIALPNDMFYNTGIATYIWVLSNNKPSHRKGKVQLIDATDRASKMRKSLGSKRQYIEETDQDDIVRLYGAFDETEKSKIFPTKAFGYRRITVERPLRLNFVASLERIARITEETIIQRMSQEEQGKILAACETLSQEPQTDDRKAFTKRLSKVMAVHDIKLSATQLRAVLKALSERDSEAMICTDSKGKPEPDVDLRDYENVPLDVDIHEYFEREVLPHVPDAWVDESKVDARDHQVGIVGYEIPFNRHFYTFVPPRPLAEIDADLAACTERIKQMIEELSA